MAVRSDRLGPIIVVPALGTLVEVFVVPAGQTWLVKRVVASNPTAPAKAFQWALEEPGGQVTSLYRPTVGSISADDHETWWALDAGCKLQVGQFGATTCTVQVFGAKLLGVA